MTPEEFEKHANVVINKLAAKVAQLTVTVTDLETQVETLTAKLKESKDEKAPETEPV
jgi:uncharacterized coiled-coil protein SlyX